MTDETAALPGAEVVLEVIRLLGQHEWWEDARESVSHHYSTHDWDQQKRAHVPAPPKFVTYMNCSDTFFWGSADSEEVTAENIHILREVLEQVKGPREAAYKQWREVDGPAQSTEFQEGRAAFIAAGNEPNDWGNSAEIKAIRAKYSMSFMKYDNVVNDLFAARVRGLRPQGAAYSVRYPEEAWEWFNACGPEREVGIGNPRKPGQ